MKRVTRTGKCPISLLVLILIIFASGAEADLREELGLVARWTFDGGTVDAKDVKDVFGENDGTIVGKPDILGGFSGDALDFDGAVDHVKMVEDIFFPSVTIEATIRPTLGTRNPIYDKYNYGIQLLDNNQVGLWIRADTNQQAKQWPSAYTPFPTDGEWHHIVGVVESEGRVRILVDGELKAETPAPDPISIAYGANDKPTIAYTRHLGGIWYAGAIDEVAVYEGALSDADVKRLYSAAFPVEAAGKLAVAWGRMKIE